MVFGENLEPAKAARNQPPAEGSALNQEWQSEHRGIVQAREYGRMPAPGLPVRGDRPPVPEPTPASPSIDAVVSMRGDGTVLLQPYEGQRPLRDYPGGKGSPEDVEATRKAIARVPGVAGDALGVAFDIFDKNYQTRVGENRTPPVLAMTDVPAPLSDRVAHWQLHYDVDLYNKETHGPLGVRDLRPNTDIAPGGGKLPKNFFAVGFDSQGKPVDVLKYDDPGTGSRYQGQYQFSYETLNDGSGMRRITVKNWVDAEQNKTTLSGPQAYMGNRLNTLAGVTQYYYDSTGHCVEAQYFKGYTFLQDRSQWKPFDDLKYPDGQSNGSIEERTRASRMDFFDLLGPRLPELSNGK